MRSLYNMENFTVYRTISQANESAQMLAGQGINHALCQKNLGFSP